MTGTAKDFCQAMLLHDRAKRLGFEIHGGWGAIELHPSKALRKRFGFSDCALIRVDTIEQALYWLAAWNLRDGLIPGQP